MGEGRQWDKGFAKTKKKHSLYDNGHVRVEIVFEVEVGTRRVQNADSSHGKWGLTVNCLFERVVFFVY